MSQVVTTDRALDTVIIFITWSVNYFTVDITIKCRDDCTFAGLSTNGTAKCTIIFVLVFTVSVEARHYFIRNL